MVLVHFTTVLINQAHFRDGTKCKFGAASLALLPTNQVGLALPSIDSLPTMAKSASISLLPIEQLMNISSLGESMDRRGGSFSTNFFAVPFFPIHSYFVDPYSIDFIHGNNFPFCPFPFGKTIFACFFLFFSIISHYFFIYRKSKECPQIPTFLSKRQ